MNSTIQIETPLKQDAAGILPMGRSEIFPPTSTQLWNKNLERVFARACLESAPCPAGPRPAHFHARLPGGGKPAQLYQMKQKLLHTVLEETGEPALFQRLCGAANEAAELAWETDCPVLLFPCLFEELVQNIRD